MLAVVIQKLREFILKNEQPIKSVADGFVLVLSVSIHITALYLWIFKSPSILEALNFKHMILEIIRQTEQKGIKQNFEFQPFGFILLIFNQTAKILYITPMC